MREESPEASAKRAGARRRREQYLAMVGRSGSTDWPFLADWRDVAPVDTFYEESTRGYEGQPPPRKRSKRFAWGREGGQFPWKRT